MALPNEIAASFFFFLARGGLWCFSCLDSQDRAVLICFSFFSERKKRRTKKSKTPERQSTRHPSFCFVLLYHHKPKNMVGFTPRGSFDDAASPVPFFESLQKLKENAFINQPDLNGGGGGGDGDASEPSLYDMQTLGFLLGLFFIGLCVLILMKRIFYDAPRRFRFVRIIRDASDVASLFKSPPSRPLPTSSPSYDLYERSNELAFNSYDEHPDQRSMPRLRKRSPSPW